MQDLFKGGFLQSRVSNKSSGFKVGFQSLMWTERTQSSLASQSHPSPPLPPICCPPAQTSRSNRFNVLRGKRRQCPATCIHACGPVLSPWWCRERAWCVGGVGGHCGRDEGGGLTPVIRGPRPFSLKCQCPHFHFHQSNEGMGGGGGRQE